MNLKGVRNSPRTHKDRIKTKAGQIPGLGQDNQTDADRPGTAPEPAKEHNWHITDSDLRAVVDAWPNLSESIKAEIVKKIKM